MSKATRRFIINKLGELVISLLIVTILSFLLVRLSPIDPAEAYAQPIIWQHLALRMSRWRRCGKIWGSMIRLPVQYVTWVRDALHLDFGKSFVSGQPVFEKVTTAIGITVTIVIDFSRYSSQFSFLLIRLSLLFDKKKNDWSCTDFSVYCRGVHPILFLCQHLP